MFVLKIYPNPLFIPIYFLGLTFTPEVSGPFGFVLRGRELVALVYLVEERNRPDRPRHQRNKRNERSETSQSNLIRRYTGSADSFLLRGEKGSGVFYSAGLTPPFITGKRKRQTKGGGNLFLRRADAIDHVDAASNVL